MASRPINTPLIVVVGPTASGKTDLALDLAEKYNGEIIAADSRTVYKGLDIGTAKPTAAERAKVPHYGLDLVNPSEVYSAAEFQRYARDKIDDIRACGKVPFIVGGTGLYINAVIYDYSFADVKEDLRNSLREKEVNELYGYCSDNNIVAPPEGMSKPHLINYIVRDGQQQQSEEFLDKNTFVVGIATNKTQLQGRIHRRASSMFDSDIITEAQEAADQYGWDTPGLSGNIYKIVRQLQSGQLTRDEAIQLSKTRDWQLAKRQLTWFSRDPNIRWLHLDEAEHYIDQVFASEH